MGRLRQMNREAKVARQAEMGKRVGGEITKKTEAERTESLRRDRGLDLQKGRTIKMDRQIPRI